MLLPFMPLWNTMNWAKDLDIILCIPSLVILEAVIEGTILFLLDWDTWSHCVGLAFVANAISTVPGYFFIRGSIFENGNFNYVWVGGMWMVSSLIETAILAFIGWRKLTPTFFKTTAANVFSYVTLAMLSLGSQSSNPASRLAVLFFLWVGWEVIAESAILYTIKWGSKSRSLAVSLLVNCLTAPLSLALAAISDLPRDGSALMLVLVVWVAKVCFDMLILRRYGSTDFKATLLMSAAANGICFLPLSFALTSGDHILLLCLVLLAPSLLLFFSRQDAAIAARYENRPAEDSVIKHAP